MADRAGPQTPGMPGSALEEVRDFFHGQGNYFAELEEAAQEIWQAGGMELGNLYRGLVDYLDRELAIRVRTMPIEVMGATRRRYDRHGRRILVSEMLPLHSRNFQLALQIGLIKYRGLLDRLVAEGGFPGEEPARLAKIGLASYLAGAVLMPYDRFYRAATAARYDIEMLQHRFEASFEQVCHRLTTLQRPGAKGVPFFMIRVDKAGNVSKRFSANRLHFARFGGACPRWNVHDAFRWPGRIHVQVSEMPDAQRYFSIAQTITKAGAGYRLPGQTFAVALGCELAYAAQLVYADGMDLLADEIAVPIGLHCRLCERLDCAQRAFPPLHHKLTVDENIRGATAYVFERQ
jgi:predicted transcriptional regulator